MGNDIQSGKGHGTIQLDVRSLNDMRVPTSAS
jgi:hypothetical protein